MSNTVTIDGPVTLIITKEGNFQVWSHMADAGVHLDILDIAVLARLVRDRTSDVSVLSATLGDETTVAHSLEKLRAARLFTE